MSQSKSNEELIAEFLKKCEYERGEDSTVYTQRCADWFKQVLAQKDKELQKARQDWLREEIVWLEAQIVGVDAPKDDPRTAHQEGCNYTLQTIIDRYQSELDHPTLEDNK